MREILKSLNKSSLSAGTGISYDRLRKYSVGLVKELTEQEIKAIHDYLAGLAEKFTNSK